MKLWNVVAYFYRPPRILPLALLQINASIFYPRLLRSMTEWIKFRERFAVYQFIIFGFYFHFFRRFWYRSR